jgi:hypothetical protein
MRLASRAQRYAGGRGRHAAGPMHRLAWRLSERQLDHAVDRRSWGNGGRLGFLVLSHSRSATLSRMNRFCERPAGFRDFGAHCPTFLGNKTPICDKFAIILLLDSVLC